MPDAPTPLDLDATTPDERAAMRRCVYSLHDLIRGGLGTRAERAYVEHVPRLLDALDAAEAEVARLRARPAPAWDEEAVRAEAIRAVESVPATTTFSWPHAVDVILAVVREHLPVKPDRKTVARALFEAGAAGAAVEFGLDGPVPWSSLDADDVERMCAQADAVLDLWPGRSEAEVKAEALREAADWLLRIGYVTDITFDIAAPTALWDAFVDAAHRDADGTVHGNTLTRAEVDDWLSVESGRLAAEGGGDRG